MISFVCAACGHVGEKSASAIRRAKKVGQTKLYCNRKCAGVGRRTDTRTLEEKRAAKSAYDRAYRERPGRREQERTYNAAWYQANKDREREREIRQANMPRHVEYCRRPEYRVKKVSYDLQRRASVYGEFAEAYLILLELQREIRQRAPSYYERHSETIKERAARHKQRQREKEGERYA